MPGEGHRNQILELEFGLNVEYRSRMSQVKRASIVAIGLVLAAGSMRADITELKDNPYKVILDRNPFGLRPAPQQPDLPPTNAPKAEVKFTGITGVGSSKRAWLMIPTGPGRTQIKYLNNLAEGDSDGDIKVVEINEKETTVKILNAGTPLTLNFQEHGLTAPAAPVVPLPGVVPMPGVVPPPGVVPAPGIPTPGVRPVSGTPYVPQPTGTPSYTPGVTPQPATGTPTTTAPVLRTIPARPLRTTPSAQPQAAQQPAVDPAVQYLNMRLNEERARSRGIPYPPTPPVPGSDN
jgi:hypothetical protein